MTAPEVVALANDLIGPRTSSSASATSNSNEGEATGTGAATYTADELAFARGLWQWSRSEQRAAVQSARRESESKLAVRALLDTAERMLAPAADADAPAGPPCSTAAALVRLVRRRECAAPLFVETILALVEPDAEPDAAAATSDDTSSSSSGGLAAQTLRELVQADGVAVVAGIVQACARTQPPDAARFRAAARLWCRVWQCVRADAAAVPDAAATVRALLDAIAPAPEPQQSQPPPPWWEPVQCAALRAAAFTLRGAAHGGTGLAWARAPLVDRTLACLAGAPPGPVVACAVRQLAPCADVLCAPPRAAAALAALVAVLGRAHDEPTVHGTLALLLRVLEHTDPRAARTQHRAPLQALRTALPVLRVQHAAEPRVQALLRALTAAVSAIAGENDTASSSSGTQSPPRGAGVPRFQPKLPQPKRRRPQPAAPCCAVSRVLEQGEQAEQVELA